MGFVPILKTIMSMLLTKHQTMLFLEMMSGRMTEVAGLYLMKPVRIEVVGSDKIANKLTPELHFVQKMNKVNKLLSLIDKY